MKEIRNFNNLKKTSNKKNITTILKKVHGVNQKSVKKINLLNGFLNLKLEKFNNRRFNIIFLQSQYFFNIQKNKIYNNVKRKMKMKNYSGMRHILKLPVRGQRTRTNANTPKKCQKKEVL